MSIALGIIADGERRSESSSRLTASHILNLMSPLIRRLRITVSPVIIAHYRPLRHDHAAPPKTQYRFGVAGKADNEAKAR